MDYFRYNATKGQPQPATPRAPRNDREANKQLADVYGWWDHDGAPGNDEQLRVLRALGAL